MYGEWIYFVTPDCWLISLQSKDGKERWHGLGSFKDVWLKDARLARDAAQAECGPPAVG